MMKKSMKQVIFLNCVFDQCRENGMNMENGMNIFAIFPDQCKLKVLETEKSLEAIYSVHIIKFLLMTILSSRVGCILQASKSMRYRQVCCSGEWVKKVPFCIT